MNRSQWVLLLVCLGMIGSSAGVIVKVRSRQVLAPPGVKTHQTSDPQRLEVDLPADVPGYTSTKIDVDDLTKTTLPCDTSFGQRLYKDPDNKRPDNTGLSVNVVLMGTDRTSLHKPQFCLEGQGWHIDEGSNLETTIPVEKPFPYDLPVVRLICSRTIESNGEKYLRKFVYVYWFVADDSLSSSVSGYQRMWMMSAKLLKTGVLQRWAYISCGEQCWPGQEDATFERMKQFIAAAVPEFQLMPHPQQAAVAENR